MSLLAHSVLPSLLAWKVALIPMSVVYGWVCRAFSIASGPGTNRSALSRSSSSYGTRTLRRRAVTSAPLSPTLLIAATATNIRSFSSRTMESEEPKQPVVGTENLDFCTLMGYASTHGPGFPVDAASISVIREPSSFFDELAVRISLLKFGAFQALCVLSFSDFNLIS